MQLPPRYRIAPATAFHLFTIFYLSEACSHIHLHGSQMKGLGFDEVWEESASVFLMNLTSKPVPINGNIV